jgi:AcrR family transcriptional regulator
MLTALLLAPGRGRYDRRTTPEERLRAQRERLLRAVARAFVEKQANVSRVTELARVGRASFYEFFDDFEHALSAVRSVALDSVERALEQALIRERAPVAALRALASDFLSAVSAWPDAALVALGSAVEEASPMGRCFSSALSHWLETTRRSGLVPPARDDTRLLLATGAAEAMARRAALESPRGERKGNDDAQQLADALLRLLR